MAKETRLQFTPPPPPGADLEALALWARRMTVLLPSYLNRMQQVMMTAFLQTYDLGVPVPGDQTTVELEGQTDITESAGEID